MKLVISQGKGCAQGQPISEKGRTRILYRLIGHYSFWYNSVSFRVCVSWAVQLSGHPVNVGEGMQEIRPTLK